MKGFNIRVVEHYKGEPRVFDRIGFQFFKIEKPFEIMDNGSLKEYYDIEELGEDFMPNEIHIEMSNGDIISSHASSVKNQLYQEDMISQIANFSTCNNIDKQVLTNFLLDFCNKYYVKHFIQTYGANNDVHFKKKDNTTFSGDAKINFL